MSELTLTLIKLGFLVVLWLFVLSVVSVIRTDIFGTKAPKASADSSKGAKQPKQSKQPKPAKQSRQSGRALRATPSKLHVTSGPDSGQSVPLGDGPILLGRGFDAAIRLSDDYVSTRHARFATNGEQWFVEDLGSTNGTFVNTRRITEPTPVSPGISVRLGKTSVELRK